MYKDKIEAVELFYLEQVNKFIDEDFKNLYQNRFLRYIRLACSDNLFYLKSECRAQMNKMCDIQSRYIC